MVSRPHLHVMVQSPQSRVIKFVPSSQNVKEGSKFLVKLHGWANVCLGTDGLLLNLYLEIFKCFHKIIGPSQQNVLHRVVKFFFLGFLLHRFEVGKRLCSVCLSLLSSSWRVPDGRLRLCFFPDLFGLLCLNHFLASKILIWLLASKAGSAIVN